MQGLAAHKDKIAASKAAMGLLPVPTLSLSLSLLPSPAFSLARARACLGISSPFLTWD